MQPVIFLHPPRGGGKYPPSQLRNGPSSTQCNFFLLMSFSINLGFAHVYTPQTFIYTPHFQIPRKNTACSPQMCLHTCIGQWGDVWCDILHATTPCPNAPLEKSTRGEGHRRWRQGWAKQLNTRRSPNYTHLSLWPLRHLEHVVHRQRCSSVTWGSWWVACTHGWAAVYTVPESVSYYWLSHTKGMWQQLLVVFCLDIVSVYCT